MDAETIVAGIGAIAALAGAIAAWGATRAAKNQVKIALEVGCIAKEQAENAKKQTIIAEAQAEAAEEQAEAGKAQTKIAEEQTAIAKEQAETGKAQTKIAEEQTKAMKQQLMISLAESKIVALKKRKKHIIKNIASFEKSWNQNWFQAQRLTILIKKEYGPLILTLKTYFEGFISSIRENEDLVGPRIDDEFLCEIGGKMQEMVEPDSDLNDDVQFLIGYWRMSVNSSIEKQIDDLYKELTLQ